METDVAAGDAAGADADADADQFASTDALSYDRRPSRRGRLGAAGLSRKLNTGNGTIDDRNPKKNKRKTTVLLLFFLFPTDRPPKKKQKNKETNNQDNVDRQGEVLAPLQLRQIKSPAHFGSTRLPSSFFFFFAARY